MNIEVEIGKITTRLDSQEKQLNRQDETLLRIEEKLDGKLDVVEKRTYTNEASIKVMKGQAGIIGAAAGLFISFLGWLLTALHIIKL